MPHLGTIITNNVSLLPHEIQTITFLREQSFDIELIPKSNLPGTHTPDIKQNASMSYNANSLILNT